MDCPFCQIENLNPVLVGNGVIAFCDRYPVSPGHLLVVPTKHYETYFDVIGPDRIALWNMVDLLKEDLDEAGVVMADGTRLFPTGYNIGINCGKSAGQTVMHCHLHLIPRYDNNMADPRGGVRGVIPEKQKY